ncbi:peptidylprolyl isomerase [uncultured Desulfobulbus sp.]|uniref:peptidylprolyl isomerase n=1 Tax=uncultured Desulfobulbus sp. TaxID=239745 RepID=UPI0029C76D3E|nr:peptidylprolyl isomerase [uncultured Desulfobulbus sp.]
MIPRLYLLAALFMLMLPLYGAFANVVDRSVAIVNEDTITLSEVNELGKSFFKKITDETPADRLSETLQQARLTVIDKLIDKKLLVQEAKKIGIQVSDQDVENALQRVLANNKTTMEEFRKELSAMGMSEKQYRDELREQVLSSKLINHEVRTKVVISEETILDYYDTHFTTKVGGSGYYIHQIGCTWGTANQSGTTPTQAEAKEKAKKAHKLAVAGDDFKELAKKYSDLPSAAEGGDLGNFQQDEMAPYMRDAVSKLKPGEISPIVETEDGYHFFQLVSSQEGKIIAHEPYESVKEQIREKLSQQAMELRFKDLLKSIREKAYIKIL